MEVRTFPVGSYQTNCYLVWSEDSDKCILIDPGYEPEYLLKQVRLQRKSLEAILLTHGHFDHVGGVKQIAAESGCDVYLCPEDLSMPPMMTAGKLYYTKTYGEGSQLHLAGLDIGVLHTPGHTPGSVCLIAENHMFSGDTLFSGSCGRTDLPGGSWATILKSLRRLADLETNYWVHPGHGESTTLTEEKRYNPYMR